MTTYKESLYNHWYERGESLLLFNSRSMALADVPKDMRARVASHALTDEEFLDLRRGGFVLSADVDELALLETAHNDRRFARNTFGLTLMPTFSCNFACGYCYQRPEDHFIGKKMSPEVRAGVLKAVDEFFQDAPTKNRSLQVVWYGGEPLLGLDVIEDLGSRLMMKARALGASYGSSIITNGYILKELVAQRLVRAGVTSAQVTIDGPKLLHDARRPLYRSPKSTYDVIITNLKALPEGLLRINLRVNVDTTSAEQVPELLATLAAEGLAGRSDINIYFAAVHSTTTSCRDVAGSCANPREFAPIQLSLTTKALELGFNTNAYPTLNLSNCSAISNHGVVVEPQGKVHKCWEMVGYDAFKVGMMTADGLTITNPQLEKTWLTWTPFKDPVCRKCDVLPMCMGGCAQRDIHREVTSFAPDDPHWKVKCNTRKFILENLVKLHLDNSNRAVTASTDCQS